MNCSEMDKYPIEKEINEGSYGKVYLLQGRQHIIKIVPKIGIAEDRRIRREIEIQSQIDMKYIVPLIDSFETSTHFYLVMKYYCGDDLFNRVSRSCRLNENRVIKYISQLVEAVYYLHSKNIIHRDIKLENILLDADDNIGLCDFGFATILPVGTSRLNKSWIGTFEYVAPELLCAEEYDFPIDIWAIGVVTYTLLTKKSPFRGPGDHITAANVKDVKLIYPNYLSDQALDFLKGILKRNPEERMKITDLLVHPWMACGPL